MLMDEMETEALGRVISGPEGNVLLGQFSRLLAQNLPPSSSGLYTVANYKRLRKGPQTFLRDA